MDLIDRYLHSIRRNLPAGRRDDIVAELRDLIASRVEDREAALGRPLTPDEAEALVKDFGHPLIVAARYRKEQWLIGPDVFPFYRNVMRILLLIIVTLTMLAGLGTVLYGDKPPLRALTDTTSALWVSVLVNIAIVTIVFVLLERFGFPAEHLRRWNPSRLPDVGDRQPGPWESAIGAAAGAAFLLWWSGLVPIPYAAGGQGYRIEPAPVWAQLYWPIFALVAARLVHDLAQWLRPRWKAVRLLLGGLTGVAGIILLSWIFRAGHWASVVSTGLPVDRAMRLEANVNLGIKVAIVAASLGWLLEFFNFLRRLPRKPSRP